MPIFGVMARCPRHRGHLTPVQYASRCGVRSPRFARDDNHFFYDVHSTSVVWKYDHVSRITFHASRFTHHVSRITFHASRFTHHVSRITFHASRFTSHTSDGSGPFRVRRALLQAKALPS